MLHDIDIIRECLKKAEYYRAASSYINFDMSTIGPENVKESEGELISFLENQEVMLRQDESYVDALLRTAQNPGALGEWDRAMVAQAYRTYRMEKNITAKQALEFSRIELKAFLDWEKAKEKSDFSMFADSLEKVIEVNKKRAELRELSGEENDLMKSSYDRRLDAFEQGMTTEQLDAFFEESRKRIGDLLKKISESKKVIRRDFLSRKVPVEKQRKISEMLQDVLMVDKTRSLIAESEHAFTDRMAEDDVRITTHYYEDNFISNIYTVLHESGHCMFDMWQPKENREYFITDGKTLGMHESVSRFYENMLGRSESFIHIIFPKLKDIIPDVLSDVSEREFYEAVNIVEPSLIRTEADELTYTLHVIIRYELEKQLIGGTLSVKDLPEAWNEKYNEYLGVTPQNDAEGVLQDVHWATDFGYFPTYAIGNFYNSMYFNTMKQELDIDAALSSGNTKKVNDWMIGHVYKKADRLKPSEWIRDITGKTLTADDFLTYLEEKYGELYGL